MHGLTKRVFAPTRVSGWQALTAVAFLLVGAALAQAQAPFDLAPSGREESPADTLSARTVWLACHHPAVAAAHRSQQDSTQLQAMRALCNGVHFVVRNGRPAIEERQTLAQVLTLVPSVATVRSYARVASWPSGPGAVDTLSAAFFDLNSADLTDTMRSRIRDFATRVRQYQQDHPEDTVDLVGGSDATGSAELNRALTLRRIEAVRTILANAGVDLRRLRTVSCPRAAAGEQQKLRRLANATMQADCEKSGAFTAMGHAVTTAPNTADRAVLLVSRPRALTAGGAPNTSPSTPAATEVLAPSPALTAGSLPLAVVDAVIAQARSDLESGLLDRALQQVCVGLHLQQLVTQTCDLRHRSQELLYTQGISAVRAALRADFQDVPYRLALVGVRGGLQLKDRSAGGSKPPDGRPAADSVAAPVREVSSELLLLAYALHTYREAPRNPWEWLAAYHAWSAAFGHQDVRVAASRVNKALEAFAALAALVDAAQAELPPDAEATLTGMVPSFEYALKSYIVLAQDPAARPPWKTESGIGVATESAVKRLYGAAMGIAQLSDDLRDARSGIGDVAARNPIAWGQALLDAARATISGPNASEADARLLSVVNAAAELHALARAGNRRELVYRLFVTADSLARPVLETGPLRTLTLSPSLRRVLAFSADLAEAQDQAAVTLAVRNFVRDGQGYGGKRMRPTEGDRRRYWTLNAYLGGSFGAEVPCSQGLHCGDVGVSRGQAAVFLPVGFEIGLRPRYAGDDTTGRGPSWGMLLQIVDLGALGAARLSGKGADTEEASMRQFFSFGLYGIRSWSASPFVGGLGVSYARDAQRTNENPLAALRPSIIVAMDVPLFP